MNEKQIREKIDEYWNEHDGTNFYKDELLELVIGLLHQAVEEERERIKDIVIHRAWHEVSCPAHSNQMESEDKCDCVYDFFLSSLTKEE